jgi:hypothetical protein
VTVSAALHCSVAALADKSHNVSLWWLGHCPIQAAQGRDKGEEKRSKSSHAAGSSDAGDARYGAGGSELHRHGGDPDASASVTRSADSHATLPCRRRSTGSGKTLLGLEEESVRAGRGGVLLAIGAAQEGRPRAGGDFGGGGRKPIVCAVMGDDVDPGAGCASCRATAFLLRQLHADHLGIQNVKPARG